MTVLRNRFGVKATIIIGDTIINGCQTFKIEDAAEVLKEHDVPANVWQTVLDAHAADDGLDGAAFTDDEDWRVRQAVAQFSDKYHDQLKDDTAWQTRRAVVQYSDKYHDQLKDDADCDVRKAVAEYSDKHHDHLKDDADRDVRQAVAEYSDKYHDQLKNDRDYDVRSAVARFSVK